MTNVMNFVFYVYVYVYACVLADANNKKKKKNKRKPLFRSDALNCYGMVFIRSVFN